MKTSVNTLFVCVIVAVRGFTGKLIITLTGSKVGRVTGLDPAGYNFAIADEADRLAKEDGAFVDVMHTNTVFTLSFGTPIGHADFYPNGGRSQPGCFWLSCSHMRATTLFKNSIKTCQYRSHRCPDGNVIPEAKMGYHAPSTLSGKYCLDTHAFSPYC
ncbi:hypothetical protein LOTGIDRAFT_175622 [Lottia gigantea]|uniref:Lipase domain-containing protein n=1 Tax=Lottia gigantea TaxID=225164 RepID=V4A8B2_LOTGI|nr:hypothetical protein LOTGIDRAFT_175622 [Lottia gigantea]ESO92957.1 hypothetical protein LOTGIDRAFT_175622 [Lottia gigantea]